MMADSSIPKSAADELSRRDELDERLRWLVTLRWVALAGVGVAVIAARALQLIGSMWPLAIVGGGMAIMNVGFHGLHTRFPVRTLRALSAEALLQIAIDVLGLGALIFFSGGLDNPFIFFFCFHVVIAAILLEKREAYCVALLSALVVLILGLADQYGWSSDWALRGVLGHTSRSDLLRYGLVFALGTTLLIAVYMVTAIIDKLRASTGDVRRLNTILNERVEMLASAERKLAAEHQRARAILECMDEGVVVVDLQGKVLLANSAAQQSAMLALDETLNKAGATTKTADCNLRDSGCMDDHVDAQTVSLVELARSDSNPKSKIQTPNSEECPAESPAQCLQEVLANGGHLCAATLALLGASPPQSEGPARLAPPRSPTLAEIELRGRRFENTVSAVRTGNETVGIVVVSRDVTERRLLERQVVHSEKLHALGNLAAGVAHELNTPLGTILGYAQMLLEDAPESHSNGNGRTEIAGQRQELKSIEDQARRCRKIVQGLLDFARKSGGGREDCSPNELVIKIRDLIAHSLELRGIDIKLDLCDPPPPAIRVAANEIEQVLVNLITNAADAIEMGPSVQAERTSTIRIETRRESSGGVLIAVEDNGPGVPAELSEQIFEPFFTTKAAGRGTGLGLSIARRIVEDHEGRLLLSRRSNGLTGARFELHLHAAVVAQVPVRV
jgi:signal transduction histidine kinase